MARRPFKQKTNSSHFSPRGVTPSKKKRGKRDGRGLETIYSSTAGSVFPYYSNAWTDSRIELSRHFKHWVYVAVSTIAEQVATQRPNISYVTTPSSPQERSLLGRSRQRAITSLQSHQDLKPVETSHPLCRLLNDPNDPDVSYDLWYETFMFLGLTGSAYWYVHRNNLGLPDALWVIPSHWMWPVPSKDRVVDHYEMRPTEGNYLRKVFAADEIIHFKLKNPISRLDGYSPLTAIGQWVDVEEAVSTAQWHAYNNGTFPTLAIQFDNDIEDPDSETLNRIEAKFISRLSGPTRSNKPLFLPPGVTAKPLTIVPNQMVFGETADKTRDKILSAYKVPHVLAGDSTKMTYGSILAAQMGFCTFNLRPKFEYIGQVVTEKLARPYYDYEDTSIKVWFEDRTPDDPTSRDNEIKTSLLCGAITPNEVRAMYGREPLPYDWANKPVMPVNMQSGALPGGGSHTPGTTNDNPIDMPDLSDEKSFEKWIMRGGISLKNGAY